MPHVEVRKATLADAEVLAPKLREADVIEVRRSAGYAPLEALVRSVVASEGRALTLLFDGEIAAMGGLATPGLIAHIGVPWLLTSDLVERHPVTFFRLAKAAVEHWSKECPTLFQFVDEEHVSARRFLTHLGFTIHKPVIHGVARAPFCPAVRSSSHV
jgi:hypothetical protein